MERGADRSLGGATGFQPPADLAFSFLSEDQRLDTMLLGGELDVLYHYITAQNLVDRSRANLRGDPRVRGLFPDASAEAARYHRSTGIYPVNHCVVIRRSVLERYPFVALNIYDAFLAASQRVVARALATLEPYLMAGLLAPDVRDVVAHDPWAYGVAASRKELETLFRYLHEQGISSRRVSIEDVFARATLSL